MHPSNDFLKKSSSSIPSSNDMSPFTPASPTGSISTYPSSSDTENDSLKNRLSRFNRRISSLTSSNRSLTSASSTASTSTCTPSSRNTEKQPNDHDIAIPSLEEMQKTQERLWLKASKEEYNKIAQIISMRRRLDHKNEHCIQHVNCMPNDDKSPACTTCKKTHCEECAKYPNMSHLKEIISVFWKRGQGMYPELFPPS